MIGDPLLQEDRLITPPGVRHPNPAHDTVKRISIGLAIVAAVLGTIAWFWAVSPDTANCITIPTGVSYPELSYDATGRWSLHGATIGYAEHEDETCLSATPVG
jgi:hypothetical protein